MMLKKIFLLLGLIFSSYLMATPKSQSLEWGGLPALWVEDSSVPLFQIKVQFYDGSLFDDKESAGYTASMFSMLEKGTPKFDQKKIAQQLDFLGASISGSASFFTSSLSISGMTKDAPELVKFACHLFNDANFSKEELDKWVTKNVSQFKNLGSSPQDAARRSSLLSFYAQTPLENPTSGRISTLEKMNSEKLILVRDYFKQKVFKKVYILGGKELLDLSKTFAESCGWKNSKESVDRRKLVKDWSETKRKAKFILVPIPETNQANIWLGRVLNAKNLTSYHQSYMDFARNYLSGGFTSKLLRELRVKRGLVYSAFGTIMGDSEVGRSLIITSTRNEKLVETLKTIEGILKEVQSKKLSPLEFKQIQAKIKGKFLFDLESSSDYLSKLAELDYQGLNISEISDYPKNVDQIQSDKLKELFIYAFSDDKIKTVIVGDPSLKSELEKIGDVEIIPLETFQ